MANKAKVGRSLFWGPLLRQQEEGHCEALVAAFRGTSQSLGLTSETQRDSVSLTCRGFQGHRGASQGVLS